MHVRYSWKATRHRITSPPHRIASHCIAPHRTRPVTADTNQRIARPAWTYHHPFRCRPLQPYAIGVLRSLREPGHRRRSGYCIHLEELRLYCFAKKRMARLVSPGPKGKLAHPPFRGALAAHLDRNDGSCLWIKKSCTGFRNGSNDPEDEARHVCTCTGNRGDLCVYRVYFARCVSKYNIPSIIGSRAKQESTWS